MEYLVHHGILGQKWGVRRYQNADGSWTEAGKKRYGRAIKRDLERQNRKHYDAKTDQEKEELHKNQRAVYKKMMNEATSSKEYKEYIKADKEYSDAQYKWMDDKGWDDDDMSTLYSTTKAMDRAQAKLEAATKKYNAKLESVWNENYSDMMGAKLKDIGHEDTAVGRQIVSDLLRNDYWYRETNVYKKGTTW